MLTKRIIPCLDVKEGRVVKGVHFENLKDAGEPAELAELYSKEGADELVFLDITASTEGRSTMLDVVEKTAKKVSIPFAVGGGISSLKDIEALLEAGADKVSMNTAAVKNKDLIRLAASEFGTKCIIAAVDAKKNDDGNGWEVYIRGGKKPTGLDVLNWCREVEKLGAGEILLTSMDRDGTKEGYDNKLNRAVSEEVNIPVTASGGCGHIEDFYFAFTEGKAEAALAASVFHFGELSISEVKEYLLERGVQVNYESS